MGVKSPKLFSENTNIYMAYFTSLSFHEKSKKVVNFPRILNPWGGCVVGVRCLGNKSLTSVWGLPSCFARDGMIFPVYVCAVGK